MPSAVKYSHIYVNAEENYTSSCILTICSNHERTSHFHACNMVLQGDLGIGHSLQLFGCSKCTCIREYVNTFMHIKICDVIYLWASMQIGSLPGISYFDLLIVPVISMTNLLLIVGISRIICWYN